MKIPRSGYGIFNLNYQPSIFIIIITIKLALILTLIFFLFVAGCVISVTVNDPIIPSDQPSLIKLIAVGILGVYEIIVRLVPSVGDYSAVSWVIKFLKKISDTLNVTKN
jgi:hypothetical protein